MPFIMVDHDGTISLDELADQWPADLTDEDAWVPWLQATSQVAPRTTLIAALVQLALTHQLFVCTARPTIRLPWVRLYHQVHACRDLFDDYVGRTPADMAMPSATWKGLVMDAYQPVLVIDDDPNVRMEATSRGIPAIDPAIYA